MIRKILSFSTVTAVALIAVGCGNPTVTVLNGGDNSTTGTPTPSPTATGSTPGMTVALDVTSVDADMGLKPADLGVATLGFTVTPQGGFTGSVTVHATGVAGAALPSGVVIADAVVPITGAAAVAGSFKINTSDLLNILPGSYANLEVSASSGSVSTATPSTFTLNIKPTVHLVTRNTGANTPSAADPMNDFWGPDPTQAATTDGIKVHLGNATTMVFVWTNAAAIQHRIHGNGAQATVNGAASGTGLTKIANQNNISLDGLMEHSAAADGSAGADFMRTIQPTTPTATTVVDFYCHTHQALQQGMVGRITIVP